MTLDEIISLQVRADQWRRDEVRKCVHNVSVANSGAIFNTDNTTPFDSLRSSQVINAKAEGALNRMVGFASFGVALGRQDDLIVELDLVQSTKENSVISPDLKRIDEAPKNPKLKISTLFIPSDEDGTIPISEFKRLSLSRDTLIDTTSLMAAETILPRPPKPKDFKGSPEVQAFSKVSRNGLQRDTRKLHPLLVVWLLAVF